jgi:hypothetical protein
MAHFRQGQIQISRVVHRPPLALALVRLVRPSRCVPRVASPLPRAAAEPLLPRPGHRGSSRVHRSRRHSQRAASCSDDGRGCQPPPPAAVLESSGGKQCLRPAAGQPFVMVLHLVGLGLGDEKDVTLKGMEAIKGSAYVYLEAYTSVLGGELAVEKLEAFYECKITVADREMVEERCAAAGTAHLLRPAAPHISACSCCLLLRAAAVAVVALQGGRDYPAGSRAGRVVPGDWRCVWRDNTH